MCVSVCVCLCVCVCVSVCVKRPRGGRRESRRAQVLCEMLQRMDIKRGRAQKTLGNFRLGKSTWWSSAVQELKP